MTAKKPTFDFDYLRKLTDLMKETGLSEVEMTEENSTVRLQLGGTQVAAPQVIAAPAAISTPQAEPSIEPKISGNVQKAPMVGTFYRSPSPEKPAFVSIGDSVKAGEPLCIIEAMKTMNQIEAEHDGTVQEILLENASPVEFGEPLFVIS